MSTNDTDQSTAASQGDTTASASKMANQYVDKARAFAKARPGATAALAGVVGLAILNTLRGRR